ncbi:MAG: EamA family transporter [Proteobacteria bacterium]|nr:EamA family transporter [Pseudomonadota bacterium]
MVRHLALLFALALIWGSSFMAIKIGVETIPPMTLAAGRVVFATLLLWGFAGIQGLALPRGGRIWFYCFLIGIIGNGLPFTLINWGEEKIDSGLAAILMAVMPLATVVMAHFFTAGDRMTQAKLLGVACGFGGVVILVGPEALKGLGGDFWRQLATAGGAICYAIAAILTRNMPAAPLIARSAAVMIAASVMMVPLSLIFDAPWTLAPSTEALLAGAYLGLFPTAVATIILFHLLKSRGASFIAPVNYLIPVFGVLWGIVALGEEVSPRAVLALSVILVGMAVAQYQRRPR